MGQKIIFEEPKKTEDLIDAENEKLTGYDSDAVAEPKAKGTAHQPFIVAVDESGSMTSSAGGDDGKSKLDICQELVNGLRENSAIKSLNSVEKDSVDMIVLSFKDNDVFAKTPWMPLSMFEGGVGFESGSNTPFYKTIIDSINFTRVQRHHYGEAGIDCKRPQVFIYTDGIATDNCNREAAKKLCSEYASVGGKVKIFVVLVPGTMSEQQINSVTSDIIDLCENITVIRANDCRNGLPAAFNFLSSSIVVGVNSSTGDDLVAEYDNKSLKVAGNTDAKDGEVKLGKQIVWN